MKFFQALFLMLLTSSVSHLCAQEKVKIYIMYTPSHDQMCKEWFLSTVPQEDNFEIVTELFEQECTSGNFMATGWLETMIHKVDIVLRGIEENWGDVFIHSDVDIQFFRPFKSYILQAMEGKDMLIQKDEPKGVACAGFFACRGNEKTQKLWHRIKGYLERAVHNMQKNKKVQTKINDQLLLNKFIRGTNPFKIVWDYLPETFFSAGTLTGKLWNPGDTLPIPDDIILHHANWTIGTDNKIAQLRYLRTEVENRLT